MHSSFKGEWAGYPQINIKKLSKKYHFERRMTTVIINSEFITKNGMGRWKKYKRKYYVLPTDEVIMSYIQEVKKLRKGSYEKRWNTISIEKKKEIALRQYHRRIEKQEKRRKVEQLIDENYVKIKEMCRLAQYKCPTKYEQADLLQDVLLFVIKNADKYDFTCHITTWIYRIAVNFNLQHYDKERTEERNIEKYNYHLLLDESLDDESEDEQVKKRKLHQAVEAIESLNGKQKEVFDLILKGEKQKDIAKRYNTTERYIKTMHYIIKKRLKKLILPP
jgi:RNA polymerase sigma-70 factor (ECF subfamily)